MRTLIAVLVRYKILAKPLAVIKMKPIQFCISIMIILVLVSACNQPEKKCEPVREWKVKDYRIVKSKCPDMVLAFYYSFDIYQGEERIGNVSQLDTCFFTWQADKERFLTLNVCENSVTELTPNKVLLNSITIDSVTIFSNELKKTQLLTKRKIETFTKDWNSSLTRGYSNEPFDSAFYRFPAYQYKLIVYSGGTERPFYGYNYLILDSSNWKYEMSEMGDYNYFHEYWKK